MLIQVVDVAGTEGRTPLEDFNVISEELEKFSPELASRPRIIAANKADLMVNGVDEFPLIPEVSEEAKELETIANALDYDVVYISAANKLNLKELIDKTAKVLETLPPVITYEPEVIPEAEVEDDLSGSESVTIRRADNAAFIVSGEWAEKLVGRVNFSDKESLMYFERSLIRGGIIDRLREAGCEEGDTVNVCGMEFEFIE
jgi:GTP-binding protein